jgi:hypothetical protein
MTLYDTWVQLVDEADTLRNLLHGFAVAGPTVASASRFTLADECLLEGILSRAWQAWGSFCRTCIVHSCVGTIDGSGAHVAPHPFALSEAHVSGAALRAKNKAASMPYWGGVNTTLRLEPTWGDVDVLTRLLPRLGSTNQAQLLAAISASSQSAKALQVIRNAAAHNNRQTMAEVLAIRSRYVVFPITHPVQAIYWTEPISSDFLAIAALDDLVDCALSAIS